MHERKSKATPNRRQQETRRQQKERLWNDRYTIRSLVPLIVEVDTGRQKFIEIGGGAVRLPLLGEVR